MALVYLTHEADVFVISGWVKENSASAWLKLLTGIGPRAKLDGVLGQAEKPRVEFVERRAVRPVLKNFGDCVAGADEWIGDHGEARRQRHRRVANHVQRLDLFNY